MEEEKFWTIVNCSVPVEPYDLETHVNTLETALGSLSQTDLEEFSLLLEQHAARLYSWDLWAVAWIVRDKFSNYCCGDDEFYAFCIGLIFQGDKYFKTALDSPDDLARLSRIEMLKDGDNFTYLASGVYAERFGETEFNQWGHGFFPNQPTGKKWEEDDVDYLVSRFPQSVIRWGVPEVKEE